MTSAWIIVLLFAAFISARLFRSTKMWGILMSAIVAGLLVGLLSREAANSFKKTTASISQLVNTVNDESAACMQSLVVAVTEGPTDCPSGVAGYKANFRDTSLDALTVNKAAKGRDSPGIEDDS